MLVSFLQEVREMNDKTNKFVKVMLSIVTVAPVIAAMVFTILFTFVLKSRPEERILHSATTFLLWMFATLFYIMMIACFKNKKRRTVSIVGMIICVALAILVTPLDRYVALCFSKSHVGSYILAAVLLVTYLVVTIKSLK
ncbi:MAG: hypothetical protein K6F55_02650 [Eubacterium sp.]|nr:hypothetical protein [Eubacterium sp.]